MENMKNIPFSQFTFTLWIIYKKWIINRGNLVGKFNGTLKKNSLNEWKGN